MTQAVVTGLGMITPIGMGVGENLEHLRKGVHGIGLAKVFQSSYAAVLPFGEVGYADDALREMLGDDDLSGYTRTCMLAALALGEAVADAGWGKEELESGETGLISASTVGGMCYTDQLYREANLNTEASAFAGSYGAAAHTLHLVRRFGIRGFADTINTACSSSANAVMLGARLIESGRLQRVIVGGADSLAKYTVNGFNALRILSEEPCKPFDEHRTGLNLGEGAAYLVLESEEKAGNRRRYGRIQGYGNSNDAFHASAMSDEATGVIGAMTAALGKAGLAPGVIGYINAHGTGTPNNDATELYGITRVFDKVPPFSSTKSFTGHTLGAAGAVEAIYSLLSLTHSELYANLHFGTPIARFGLAPVLEYRSAAALRYVLSNSFGFGGNCTSLVFAKS